VISLLIVLKGFVDGSLLYLLYKGFCFQAINLYYIFQGAKASHITTQAESLFFKKNPVIPGCFCRISETVQL
jgi:hypothetical protein